MEVEKTDNISAGFLREPCKCIVMRYQRDSVYCLVTSRSTWFNYS